MIGRLWKTGLKPGRGDAYETFAREISLPMFCKQKGFLGCVMSRDDETGLVMTFWEDLDAVKALDTSPTYQETVSRILAADLLTAEQTTTIGEVHLLDLAKVATGQHDIR
ncbi:antibiotic biosynthesis monooxygenase family protein [Rhodoligotrophos defluvii]|uniref:antibiotic biosynthesis monooxygenase family protein n=1 Tax=Rhodoligotrophos defluvii TaxID=2561934 RepID=UPI0010C94BE1|nr:antibiotic biosynthesis monooxygenase [Rhodoligotrophos defluvii]